MGKPNLFAPLSLLKRETILTQKRNVAAAQEKLPEVTKPRWCTCRPKMTETQSVAIKSNSAPHIHSSTYFEGKISAQGNLKVSSTTGKKPCRTKWHVKLESRQHRLMAARLVHKNRSSARKLHSLLVDPIAVNPRDKIDPQVFKGSRSICAPMPSHQLHRTTKVTTSRWSTMNSDYKSVSLARMSLIY